MKRSHALLLELGRDALIVLARELSLPLSGREDVPELVALLAESERLSLALLIRHLSVVQLRRVCTRLGMPPHGDRPDLEERLLVSEASAPVAGSAPPGSDRQIVQGALVSWGSHEELGVVSLLEGSQATVNFDSGQARIFNVSSGVLKRIEFSPGSQVMRTGENLVGVVLDYVPDENNPTWRVSFPGSIAHVAEVGLRPAVLDDPVERMRASQLGTADQFNLRAVAADYWTAHNHNPLVSLGYARVDLKPHQVFVVHKVVSNYPHRFLLCDEVGLGKTIEAGMIIKELRARGQAKRVLILVPAGLLRQWQFELKSKFNETFAIYDRTTLGYLKGKGVENPWTDHDSIIASHAWASWTPQRRAEIADVDWDMIIVDEAHHARLHRYGRSVKRTQLYDLVRELVARPEYSRRAALFLTATPMQLNRYELYSLVEMLDPILFASEEEFKDHVESLANLNQVVEGLMRNGKPESGVLDDLVEDMARYLQVSTDEAEKLVIEETAEELADRLRAQHRVSEVLIRNRKAVVGGFQPRKAFRWEVELSEPERRIHDLMGEVFNEGFQLARETNQNAIGFLMITLQKLLASSSRALLTSLRKRRERLAGGNHFSEATVEEQLEDDVEVSEAISGIAPNIEGEIKRFDEVVSLLEGLPGDSKAQVLLGQVELLFDEEPRAKVVVFTEFRETQDMLRDLLSSTGWGVQVFHGQLPGQAKERAIEAFRLDPEVQILVSTEAGGEGRNFQFAHHLVNYDLPWNPMKVEQRIGRLDRIGQEHPVTIFNFHVAGTIEGRILEVLDSRIRVFQEAVGGLDPILGEAEGSIRKALQLAREEQEAEIERLGRRLEEKILEAKGAEVKLHDLILEAKSFGAEIAQKAQRVESPVSQPDFERFLTQLLASANTYIGPEQPGGERQIVFHPPFTFEHPELMLAGETRRVCFNPRLHIDSEYVEYLGFGHPIVDALVRRCFVENHDGAAAIRRIEVDQEWQPEEGWLFNWHVKIGGLQPRDFLLPIFVSEDGRVDTRVGQLLLHRSRAFRKEASAATPPIESFDEALIAAQQVVGARRDEELLDAQRFAGERAAIEEERARAVYEARARAAEDRISACEATLQRLEASTDSRVRQVIPLWTANLERAHGERGSLADDLEKQLIEINRRRNPSAEYALLNLARIEISEEANV